MSETIKKTSDANQILDAFRNGAWVDVFYSNPNGYQKVYEEKDLLEALESKRAVRVLDPMDLNKVIMRY